jgi:hypothetical protein
MLSSSRGGAAPANWVVHTRQRGPEVDVGFCGAAPCRACHQAHRPKTPRTRHFPGIAEARIVSAVEQLAWPQSGIELVEARDFTWRHAAGEIRRHEFARMIEAGSCDQLRQSMECRGSSSRAAICRPPPERVGASGLASQRRPGICRCGSSGIGCSRART